MIMANALGMVSMQNKIDKDTNTAAILPMAKICPMVHQMTPKIGKVPNCIDPELYLDLAKKFFMPMFCLLCYIVTLNCSMIITKM